LEGLSRALTGWVSTLQSSFHSNLTATMLKSALHSCEHLCTQQHKQHCAGGLAMARSVEAWQEWQQGAQRSTVCWNCSRSKKRSEYADLSYTRGGGLWMSMAIATAVAMRKQNWTVTDRIGQISNWHWCCRIGTLQLPRTAWPRPGPPCQLKAKFDCLLVPRSQGTADCHELTKQHSQRLVRRQIQMLVPKLPLRRIAHASQIAS
jgi:hypothetical protein